MLKDVDLTQKLDKKQYKKELKNLQYRLLNLQRILVDHKIGCILAFEGWDAAGKGGAIKRITERLDPRGYEVHAIGAPSQDEKQFHYFQRFWSRIPRYGKIGIFDRTWYGRVLVERVEQFASTDEWSRAYEEINFFERLLTEEGYIVIKCWFHISKEEQLQRFNSRRQDPLRQWKITEEDWRNREKWDEYENAVEDMIAKTYTDNAPWNIIEGEDKKFARVKCLHIIVEAIERECEKRNINI